MDICVSDSVSAIDEGQASINLAASSFLLNISAFILRLRKGSVKSREENCDILSTSFAYPQETRKIIYTTNIIEGLNRQFRQITKDVETFKSYRREYKKRFALTKIGKISPAALYAWGEKAREKKTECESGKITLDEYQGWLKDFWPYPYPP